MSTAGWKELRQQMTKSTWCEAVARWGNPKKADFITGSPDHLTIDNWQRVPGARFLIIWGNPHWWWGSSGINGLTKQMITDQLAIEKDHNLLCGCILVEESPLMEVVEPRVLKSKVVTFQSHICRRGRGVCEMLSVWVGVRGKPQKTAQRPTFVFTQHILGSPNGYPTYPWVITRVLTIQVVNFLSCKGHLTSDLSLWYEETLVNIWY